MISLLRSSLAVVICLSIVSCKNSPPASAPVAVSVVAPVQVELVEWDEYPARIESPNIVNLSPRISGEIVSAPFEEGALVKEGDVLFRIDPRPYAAELQAQESALLRSQAAFELSQIRLRRYDQVKGTKALSADAYDEAVATSRQARAELQAANASADTARLNFSWTNVVAPISGRVGRKLYTAGNMVIVSQGLNSPMTTIAAVDPMHAYVQVPERALLRYQQMTSKNKSVGAKTMCGMMLENETKFAHEGVIDFIDNHVDPQTGTIQVRCVIPNSDGVLTSGLFARVRLPGGDKHPVLLIPDKAVIADQAGKSVLALQEDGTTQIRSVKLAGLYGPLRIVREGLSETDRIVFLGQQSAKPGTKVVATEVKITDEELGAARSSQ